MELWDLYDADRHKLGQTMERGGIQPVGTYRMVVHACVFNRNGEMLIQQRQPFKSGWSNMWDVTVGGSAVSGDTSRMAVERELFEELGLHLSFESIRPAFTLNFDWGFDDFYLVYDDPELSTLHLQYEEVQAVKWASREEIMNMIEEGIFIPYYESFVELLFFLKDRFQPYTGKDKTVL